MMCVVSSCGPCVDPTRSQRLQNSGYGHGCLPGERGQLSGPPKQVSSSRVLTDVPHSSKFPMYSISRRGRVLTLRTRGPGTTPASARTPSVPGKASQFASTESEGLEDGVGDES